MKQLFSIFLVMALVVGAQAQQVAPSKYWVRFTDKNNSPYSLSNPSAYLSQRAIHRRNVQGIPITENDLPVDPAYVDSVLSTGVTLLNRSKWFNAVSIYTTDSVALAKIQSFPFVAQVQLVNIIKWRGPSVNTNSSTVRESEAPPAAASTDTYSYGSSYNQAHMIDVDCLHNQGYSGDSMVIAILDAGFENADTLHAFDSLRAHNQILGTKDFVQPGDNVYASSQSFHGMMVLSTMGGNLPGKLVGTAPKAKYWLCRTEDVSSEYVIEEDNWASAAEFADSAGADIINTSLGYTVFDDTTQGHTYADMDGHTCVVSIAADIAVSKGMFVVCSAGNEGSSPWHYIGAPADADSALTVGAVDAAGGYASFSSTGPTADGRVKPDVVAQGYNSVVASLNGGITNASGTSFSSPITAGAVACLWEANPTMKSMDLLHAIQQSATQYNNPDSLLGYGIPDFCLANQILAGMKSNHIIPDRLSAYPNPFVNTLQFAFYSNKDQSLNISVYDVLGRKELTIQRQAQGDQWNRYAINKLAKLTSGVYLLSVTTKDGKSYSKEVVKY